MITITKLPKKDSFYENLPYELYLKYCNEINFFVHPMREKASQYDFIDIHIETKSNLTEYTFTKGDFFAAATYNTTTGQFENVRFGELPPF